MRCDLIRRAATTALAAAVALAATSGAAAKPDEKVTICHHTASETNPVVLITISRNALDKHLQNHGHTGPDQEFIDGERGGPIGEF